MTISDVVLAVAIAAAAFPGLVAALSPQTVIRWQSRMLRFLWQQILGIPVDRVPERWRRVIVVGESAPETFGFNMVAYRTWGVFVLIVALTIIALLVLMPLFGVPSN
jgi:hypothetical protein